MTCRDVIEFLDEYLAGELSAEVRELFDSHLAVCSACVHFLHTYRKTIHLSRIAYTEGDSPSLPDCPEELIQAILKSNNRQPTAEP